jgi:hypothetical protein
MWSLHFAAVAAIDQRWGGQKDVATPVALTVAADPLFR